MESEWTESAWRFLSQSMPAALLGGLYHDREHRRLVNTLHLYVWIALFATSLVLGKWIRNDPKQQEWIPIAYGCAVFVVFGLLKVTNYGIHITFNKVPGPPIEATQENEEEEKEEVMEEQEKVEKVDDILSTPESMLEVDNKSSSEEEVPIVEEELSVEEEKQAVEPVGEESVVPSPYKWNGHDTSAGSVHTYIDEYGQVQTYTFGSDPTGGLVEEQEDPDLQRAILQSQLGRLWGQDRTERPRRPASISISAIETSVPPQRSPWLTRGNTPPSSEDERSSPLPTPRKERVRATIGGMQIPLPLYLDRQALEQLLDRNYRKREVVFSVLLASLTAGLGLVLAPLYQGWGLGFLYISQAGALKAQYSLLKSAQPDGNSPQQDNRWSAYSRALYFSVMGLFVLILREIQDLPSGQVYGLHVNGLGVKEWIQNGFRVGIPTLPLALLFGWLPQANTWFQYVLEQIQRHLLGGTGTVNAMGALLHVVLGSIAVALLCSLALLSNQAEGWWMLWSGILVAVCYVLARTTSNVRVLREHIRVRWVRDVGRSMVGLVVYTLLTWTGVFRNAMFMEVVGWCCVVVGGIVHYLVPNARSAFPFGYFAAPFLSSHERLTRFPHRVRVTWFERWTRRLMMLEKSVLYPSLVLSAAYSTNVYLVDRVGMGWTVFLVSLAAVRVLRRVFSDPSRLWMSVWAALVFFSRDMKDHSEGFLIDLALSCIGIRLLEEMILKMDFMAVYIAPWNISWGSIVHMIAQFLALPHIAFCTVELLVSTFLSAPLYPFVGSVAFLVSYPRPIKYWEKQYKTHRLDVTTSRLQDAVEGGGAAEQATNLNAVFYEQLNLSLQQSLCRDVEAGRWGALTSGDFYFLINDDFTALIHIVERGAGFVTYQLRGLEFVGTYCQNRELERIVEVSQRNEDDRSSCCALPLPATASICTCGVDPPGSGDGIHLPAVVSLDSWLEHRRNCWYTLRTDYILEAYAIANNPARTIFDSYDFLRQFTQLYVNAVLYFFVLEDDLSAWLNTESMVEVVSSRRDPYVDADMGFTSHTDVDFDPSMGGITLSRFDKSFGDWVRHLVKLRAERRGEEDLPNDSGQVGSVLHSMAFGLSTMCRRLLRQPLPGCPVCSERRKMKMEMTQTGTEGLLFRYYALFRGDVRITSPKDEWVFAAMGILQQVLVPGVRLSLRLHQDSFSVGPFDTEDALVDEINETMEEVIVTHESDPAWQQGILDGRPQLLALRRDGFGAEMEHKIVRLSMRPLKFTILKLNREMVRGQWAAQQQELVFLGNDQSERGSIQNFPPVLRNLVNQSCDLPVGYPVFIGGLTTSFSSFQEPQDDIPLLKLLLHDGM